MIWILLLACIGDKSTDDSADTTPIPIACGELSCDARVEYCYSLTGGIPDTAGGANVSYSCQPLPEECLDDRSCTCLMASDAGLNGATCTEEGGGLYAAVAAP